MMTRPWATTTLLIALAAAALLTAAGCSTKVKPYECPALSGGPSVDAQQLWDCNREIMVRVAKGKRFTIREFAGAAEFFESVTGIPAATQATNVGPVPGKGIKQDLRRWDAWLETHRIHWDPDDRRVKGTGGEEGEEG
jgi:hypothetical protein